ncbi:MAG: alpha/beta fold hydrolase, partial [Chitinophagaceae bacterium]
LFELDILHTNIKGLVKFLDNFIKYKKFPKVHLIGNSLGGHIALVYTLSNPEKVETLTLTGSSGLFESGMGESYPKRGSYEYIKKKAEEVFFDSNIATKELVDEVYETVNNRIKILKIIWLAKSATRSNMSSDLQYIKTRTLLIWGKEDKVTPPFVGKEFHEGLQNSELHMIEQCGHSPMMEQPKQFNAILEKFLEK